MKFVVLANQLEEQFFQVALVVAVAQLLERAFGQDMAAMHNGDPVAELFGLAHDVRGKNDALAIVAQLGNRLQQRPGNQHVEPARGFVEDQHRRIVDDGPSDRDFLFHAGRHLGAQHVADVVHLEPLEQLFHPRAAGGSAARP